MVEAFGRNGCSDEARLDSDTAPYNELWGVAALTHGVLWCFRRAAELLPKHVKCIKFMLHFKIKIRIVSFLVFIVLIFSSGFFWQFFILKIFFGHSLFFFRLRRLGFHFHQARLTFFNMIDSIDNAFLCILLSSDSSD